VSRSRRGVRTGGMMPRMGRGRVIMIRAGGADVPRPCRQ
jgi:hypothetical protein